MLIASVEVERRIAIFNAGSHLQHKYLIFSRWFHDIFTICLWNSGMRGICQQTSIGTCTQIISLHLSAVVADISLQLLMVAAFLLFCYCLPSYSKTSAEYVFLVRTVPHDSWFLRNSIYAKFANLTHFLTAQ